MSCAKRFERIMSDAIVRAPGIVNQAARVEIFNVLDEFFRNTSIWQEDISLGVITDKIKYELDSDEWAAVINELLFVVNKDGIGVTAAMPTPGTLLLYTPPSENSTYIVRVALTVADIMDDDGFPQLPEWVVIKYRETIKDGLLARLCSQPAKPYFNEKMGTYHGMRFRAGMASAYADMKQAHTFGAQAWRYPQSFATGRR
jgi:hypothetical protein